jgi:protein TonB
MSYLDRTNDPSRRTTAIAGVIVVHALLGYVLLSGLAIKYAPNLVPPLVSSFDPADPPPPPPPTPQPRKPDKPISHDETVTAPTPKADLTDGDTVVAPSREDETVIIDFPPPRPTPTYTPPHTLGLTPKVAIPRNDPGRWALTDDYPSRDLREGNEGTTGFRVVIGTDGRVGACEVVRSSGHPGLDAATCKAVAARARFAPATDANGEKVVGTYANSVRWQIPR